MSTSLLVALLAALLAGSVSGLTGFGLALISVPLLLFVYQPQTVVFVTFALSVLINAAVVWDSFRDADLRLVAGLLVPAFVGVALGTEALRLIDPLLIRLLVGAVVVLSAGLLIRNVRLPGAGTLWGTLVAGGTSGALSTATGLAGPPIVLLLASRGYAKHAFRGSSALYFLVVSAFALALLPLRGLVEPSDWPLALILAPAALIGKYLGTSILKRVSESAFHKLTLVLTFATGALGVATAAWALLS